jgi:mitochondrial splicing suppressor protein 51
LRQKAYGRIELSLPHKVLRKSPVISTNVDDTYRMLYKNITAFKDDCVKAALSQISTCPLTAYYAQQSLNLNLDEQMVIHLIGKFL